MTAKDEPDPQLGLVNSTSALLEPEAASPDDSPPVELPGMETPLARSQTAYEKDLPELLKSHPGAWVAYADGKQVRIAKNPTELYRHCLNDLGLTHDRFVVSRIVPDSGREVEYNPR